MINSKNIISIGPAYTPPKGGIAQCVATYKKYVYRNFRYIANSCDGSFLRKLAKMFFSIIKLLILLSFDHRIKIVHIHTASNNSFKRSSYYLKIAKVMRKKIILHIHGGGFKKYYTDNKDFVNSVLNSSDAIITLSDSWKEFYQQINIVKNVFVVPNIISNPVIKKVSTDGRFHLLYLGHICKAKGIFDLVNLLKEYYRDYVGKLVLDIGGGLYEEDVLRKMIKDYGLEEVICFHGWISGNDKYTLFNKANAFILPSYTEGVPISILEAESYGLPILATNVGGIPEIVKNGENGFLFSPGDKGKMKFHIDYLLQNASLCICMGERSKFLVRANFPESVENRLMYIYKKMLNH